MCDGGGEFMLVRGHDSLEFQQWSTWLHSAELILYV
jgi:hypothetical protein